MKCLFCSTEMQDARTPGLLVCPHCDTHVYMKERKLIPGKNSPSWLIDSFNFLMFCAKQHPDLTMSRGSIFTADFQSSDTISVFNNKRIVSQYKQHLYPTCNLSTNISDVSDLNVVTFKSVVAFRFCDTLAANLSAMANRTRVPMLTLEMCDASRYLWQAFVATNLDADVIDKYSKKVYGLCSTSAIEFIDGPDVRADKQLCVIAGMYRDTRFKDIVGSKDTWDDAIFEYFNSAIQRTLKEMPAVSDYQKAEDKLYEATAGSQEGNTNFIREILATYSRSSLALRDIMDSGMLLDPEYPCGIDTTVFDLLRIRDSSSVFTNELNRYKLYAELLDKYVPTDGGMSRYTVYNTLMKWGRSA